MELVKIDFGTVSALNLDDKVSLRMVYDRLVELKGTYTRFNDWCLRVLEYYQEGTDFYSDLSKNTGRGRPSKDYTVSVQIAMEILANGNGQVGHEMRRFMSNCVKLAAEQNQLTSKSPADMFLAMAIQYKRVETEQAQQKQQLQLVTQVVADSVLSPSQVTEIEQAIDTRLKELGLSASRKFHPAFYSKIKRELLEGRKTGKTFKDIPRSRFADALSLVANTDLIEIEGHQKRYYR